MRISASAPEKTETRYFNAFLRCKRADLMLRLGLFPNAKEVSESFGAYEAVRTHLQHLLFMSPDVTMIAVADGHTPRTGATFALRSAWQCHSVDPVLRETGRRGTGYRPPSKGWHEIERLTVHARKAEEVTIEADGPVVIVAVHSHASLDAAVNMVRGPGPVAAVAIPCCVPQELRVAPDVIYKDACILSPSRSVMVWREVPR